MKHRILAALVSAALCISLAGCADALDIPQPTLEELLDEVNAEHQSIQRDELDPTPYLRTSLSLEDQSKAREYMTETFSDYDADLKLDHSQAVEDVNYLFEACYYAYGLYDYFGGHPAFDAAQEAILHDLEDQDTVTCQQLEQIIASHLGFIKDGHFQINETGPAPTQIPFFFRQTAFLKTENGYQTVCGASGGHLSGGERQRISIARAMLKDAPIVILDEATSYTDPENEAVIQSALARLVRGKTLLVIAHRLSTIADADQIIVVNQGKIEATGTQAELLASCPLYQTMWEAHISVKDDGEVA